MIFRPSIGWKLDATRTASLGYASVKSTPQGRPATHEHRTWQQLSYRIAGDGKGPQATGTVPDFTSQTYMAAKSNKNFYDSLAKPDHDYSKLSEQDRQAGRAAQLRGARTETPGHRSAEPHTTTAEHRAICAADAMRPALTTCRPACSRS